MVLNLNKQVDNIWKSVLVYKSSHLGPGRLKQSCKVQQGKLHTHTHSPSIIERLCALDVLTVLTISPFYRLNYDHFPLQYLVFVL